jgi:hypothetical protein
MRAQDQRAILDLLIAFRDMDRKGDTFGAVSKRFVWDSIEFAPKSPEVPPAPKSPEVPPDLKISADSYVTLSCGCGSTIAFNNVIGGNAKCFTHGTTYIVAQHVTPNLAPHVAPEVEYWKAEYGRIVKKLKDSEAENKHLLEVNAMSRSACHRMGEDRNDILKVHSRLRARVLALQKRIKSVSWPGHDYLECPSDIDSLRSLLDGLDRE